MKVLIALLLLNWSVLSISSAAAAILLLPHSNNDGNLHYYRKYRNSVEGERVGKAVGSAVGKAAKNSKGHLKPADTFHLRQKLRAEAYKLRQHIVDAKHEVKAKSQKQETKLHKLQDQVEQVKAHYHDLIIERKQKSQGLKYKINHEEKFREVYKKRADENAAAASLSTNASGKQRLQNLSNWDKKQAEGYAKQASANLNQLKANENSEERLHQAEEHRENEIEKEEANVAAKGAADRHKGDDRVHKLEEREANLQQRISVGKSMEPTPRGTVKGAAQMGSEALVPETEAAL